ncbi:MAG: efflux RND transporter periplasmic adaptor subunit [Clostridiales bacterium]|nr:efflux RND transporter periplasmic adaptor subunit [Clostridiales bacterium]
MGENEKQQSADNAPETAGEKKKGLFHLPELPKRDKSKKKRRKKSGVRDIVIRIVVLLVILGAAFYAYRRYTASKAVSAVSSEQRTTTVTRGTLTSELSSSGTISPKDTYTITSRADGEVIWADFEEGDQVEKDQVLYQIDVSSMESEMKSATNSLTRATNSYNDAVEDYNQALIDYSGNTYKSTRTGFIKDLLIEVGDKVGSNTEVAEIYNDQTMKIRVPFLNWEAESIGVGAGATLILEDTEEELTGTVTAVANMDEVLAGGRMVRYVTIEVANPGGLSTSHQAVAIIGDMVCTEQAYFEPITDTTMKAELTSNVEVAQMLVNEGDYVTVGTPIFLMDTDDAEDLIQSYKDQVDSAETQMESAQSSLDSKQETYDNYTITAPISGQVITKSVKVGDNINNSNSTTTLATIYDLSELTFEMSIDELDVRSVQVGQLVEVTADALDGVQMTGHVTNISLESSQSNGVTNYPVTVTMDEVGDLLPGMNVDGVIILDEAEDVLMIPVDSLMRGNLVYVKDDTVTEAQGLVPAGFRAVQVSTGLTSTDYVEITDGLSEGDEIYVDESSSTTTTFQMGGMGNMGGGRP